MMDEFKLPQPELSGGKILRQNIQERSSNRSFDNERTVSVQQLSVILWAAYGMKTKNINTIASASYTIPSAGAIYPLEIFVLVGKEAVINLREGIYYYAKENNALRLISDLDKRKELAFACLNQKFIEDAPVSIIIAAKFDAMQERYGDRAERYITLEAGHAAQDIYLVTNDLGLTTVEVGAFIDAEVTEIIKVKSPVLLVMPVGYKK